MLCSFYHIVLKKLIGWANEPTPLNSTQLKSLGRSSKSLKSPGRKMAQKIAGPGGAGQGGGGQAQGL